MKYILLNPTFTDIAVQIDNPEYIEMIKDRDNSNALGKLTAGDIIWLARDLCLRLVQRTDKFMYFERV